MVGNPILMASLGPRAAKMSATEIKDEIRRAYDRIYADIDASPLAAVWLFMNYGFRAPPTTEPGLSPDGTRLLLEVVGDCALVGRDILDVGCGRGGPLRVLAESFDPGRLVGIDISATAIAASRRILGDRVELMVGDAEALPVADAVFDVVLNIESLSHYPDPVAFFSEVTRVLRPGGALLLADLFEVDQVPVMLDSLAALGLECIRDVDLTGGVLAAREAVAATALFAEASEERAEFLALPDSDRYRALRAGALCYRALCLRYP